MEPGPHWGHPTRAVCIHSVIIHEAPSVYQTPYQGNQMDAVTALTKLTVLGQHKPREGWYPKL